MQVVEPFYHVEIDEAYLKKFSKVFGKTPKAELMVVRLRTWRYNHARYLGNKVRGAKWTYGRAKYFGDFKIDLPKCKTRTYLVPRSQSERESRNRKIDDELQKWSGKLFSTGIMSDGSTVSFVKKENNLGPFNFET